MGLTDVYNTYDEFRAMVDTWVEHFACPVPLLDWCMEHDLKTTCVRYAIEESAIQCSPRADISSPLYPQKSFGPSNWRWYGYVGLPRDRSLSYWVPRSVLGETQSIHDTALNAILWLMEKWG